MKRRGFIAAHMALRQHGQSRDVLNASKRKQTRDRVVRSRRNKESLSANG
jgi:hypothetical protein